MIARHGTAAHVERLVQAYRRVGRDEAQAQLENRRFSYYVDEDGSYVIRGRLTPEQGERLMLALDAAVDAMPREDDLCPTQRRADALERLADRTGAPSGRTATARRAPSPPSLVQPPISSTILEDGQWV